MVFEFGEKRVPTQKSKIVGLNREEWNEIKNAKETMNEMPIKVNNRTFRFKTKKVLCEGIQLTKEKNCIKIKFCKVTHPRNIQRMLYFPYKNIHGPWKLICNTNNEKISAFWSFLVNSDVDLIYSTGWGTSRYIFIVTPKEKSYLDSNTVAILTFIT